jgi:transcriptional regulator with XRE-family HTH domain
MSEIEWRLTAESAKSIRETVGKNIRRERELAGLGLGDLAERSGISRNTISRMEAGRQEPRLATVIALSFALHVPLKVLVADLPAPPDVRGSGR